MKKSIAVIILALCILLSASASYGYKVANYEDEFEGLMIAELTDNDISAGWGDNYDLYLNLQKVNSDAGPLLSFVVIYISDKASFDIANGESLIFLADGKKISLSRYEGYKGTATAIVNNIMKNYKLATAAGEIFGDALFGSKRSKSKKKLTFFHDIALYKIPQSDLGMILLGAKDVKIKLVGTNGSGIVEKLDTGDLKSLRRFYVENAE